MLLLFVLIAATAEGRRKFLTFPDVTEAFHLHFCWRKNVKREKVGVFVKTKNRLRKLKRGMLHPFKLN